MRHERCDTWALDARYVLSETANCRFVEAIKAKVVPRDSRIDTNQAAPVETQKMFGRVVTPKCLGAKKNVQTAWPCPGRKASVE